MSAIPQKSGVTPKRRRIDPALAGIVVGDVILIVAGLIAIPLAARRSPALAPETTPEGVVQRFYQAAYAGDYAAAHGYLAAEARVQLSALDLQQQLAPQLQQTQMRVISTMVHDDSANVRVALTHFQPGGLFGSNEWTEELDIVLTREGQAWKIVGGPFYLPPKP
jgi:hypothetical protein